MKHMDSVRHAWKWKRVVILNSASMITLYTHFQAEDGIRDDVESRGLGDVYKRQTQHLTDKSKNQHYGNIKGSRCFSWNMVK
ncbi:hypothetical protein ACX3VG_14290 [Escherichia coli]